MAHYMEYGEIQISEKWFAIGKSQSGDQQNDVAFKFIAYWIAFNGLFAKEDRNEEEAVLIRNYVEKNYHKLKGIINFERMQELDVFFEAPVFRGNDYPKAGKNYATCYPSNNQIRHYQTLVNSQEEKERLIALLLTIKQVRNNLFHGQKTPFPQRNYDLVYSSQFVLGMILDTVIVI